jgi:hypothetical protein
MSELTSNRQTPNTSTTPGYIDSASITHVVQAYEVHPNESYPCGWTVPRLVTSFLISTKNIGLAPGTAEDAKNKIWSEGPIGDVTRNLLKSGIISRPPLDDAMQKKVLRQTQHQVSTNYENLRRRFNDLRQKDETQHWMDWSIRSAWEEHAQNFGSLIDRALVPQLAQILEANDKELYILHKETGKPDIVKNLVKRQPDTGLFKMTYNCFLLGALLRGFYHDLVATHSEQQIVHHPLREAFLPPTHGESFVFDQTKVENYLTNIVLHDALKERTLKGRLSRWANNIGKLRYMNIPGYEKIDLRPPEDPDIAKERATNAAKTVGIIAHPIEVEEFLARTAKATIDLGSYLLTPFVGYSNTGLEYFGVKTDELIRKGVRAYYGRHSRLSKLAESPPGRISTYKQVVSTQEDLC